MRLSTIAVCLLLVSPSPVLACFEHVAEQPRWIQEVPSSPWETARAGVDAMRWDGVSGMGLIGAGSASIALVLGSFRAFTRAADRGPMQPTYLAEGGDGDREAEAVRRPEPGPGPAGERVHAIDLFPSPNPQTPLVTPSIL